MVARGMGRENLGVKGSVYRGMVGPGPPFPMLRDCITGAPGTLDRG